MAIFTAGASTFNMQATTFYYTTVSSNVLTRTNTQFRLRTPQRQTQEYFGSFTYKLGNLVSGNITMIRGMNTNGSFAYSVSGIALNVRDYLSYANQGNASGLWRHLARGNDIFNGGPQPDVLYGHGGNDTINGGANTDTAGFSGMRSQYQITRRGDGVVVVQDTWHGRDGRDELRNIEYLRFSNMTISVASLPIRRSGTARTTTGTTARTMAGQLTQQAVRTPIRTAAGTVPAAGKGKSNVTALLAATGLG